MLFYLLLLQLALHFFLDPIKRNLWNSAIWVERVIVPDKYKNTFKHSIKDALQTGWPRYLIIIGTMLIPSIIITSFLIKWWYSIIAFLLLGVLTVIAEKFSLIPNLIERYLGIYHMQLVNRRRKYEAKGNSSLAIASTEMIDILEDLIEIYSGSNVKVPDHKKLKKIIYGDKYSLLD